MRFPKWATLLLCTLVPPVLTKPRDFESRDYFALHLSTRSSPQELARSMGAEFEGSIGQLPDHYTFSVPKHHSALLEAGLHRSRKRSQKYDPEGGSEVLWYQKQRLRPRLAKRMPPPPAPRHGYPPPQTLGPDPLAVEARDDISASLQISDPIFKEQWHIFNTIQLGHDLNVTGVWLQGITGNGSITSVIDDGLDMYSDDLKDNYFASGSYDYNDPGPEPRPRLFDDKHGTRCAGEIAAGRNNVCGVGMAYDGMVSGIRILSRVVSDEDEAAAINHGYQDNQIYSCSWGPPDDGMTMDAPSTLIQRAMVNGVQHGRGGLGSIFVFAAGNGAAVDDNCNFDGYTNSIYSITVGAIDREGNHPRYSEPCSAQLVVTYSSGSTDGIHTTDVGIDRCFGGHGGTSAAGPLVAGTVALALGLRPDLTWRDMQYLCVDTAIPIHVDDGDWQDTKIGKKFSHVYGYGKIDAWRLIEAAKTFQSVKAQAWYHSPWLSVQHDIPQGDQGLASSFLVTQAMLTKANLETLEHVTVTMNVNHTRRGDLSVELRSPEGLVSHLSTTRRNDNAQTGYEDWTFMSLVHWGESGIGTWTVIVKDTEVNANHGRFVDWRLSLWGECIDEAHQTLHPYPDEHDDDHETTTGSVATISVEIGETPTDLPANPTDHIDRPVNAKPSPSSTSPSLDAIPSSTSITTSLSTPTHTPSDSFLPSFFPTFGVSKRTQIWIYGALVLMILFFMGLGAFFLYQRRKRLRNDPRDDYEFEVLETEDDNTGTEGQSGEKQAKRRAGELYDAFAGESDEELFSSDEEGEPYRDPPDGGDGRGPHGAETVDATKENDS